jgi:hypothetical protein
VYNWIGFSCFDFWGAEVENMRKLSLLFACLLFVVPCSADTIIVDANGTGDYPTIQDAINAANDYDIIVLQPGLYHENLNLLSTKTEIHSPEGSKK